MQFSRGLLKGVTDIIVLNALNSLGATYGYQLIKTIQEQSNSIFELQEGTLYPLLYRLEENSFVTSKKKSAPNGKMRRYYSITTKGKAQLKERKKELSVFIQGLEQTL